MQMCTECGQEPGDADLEAEHEDRVDADDFKGAGKLTVEVAKVLTDGIVVLEEFAGESLVDHGDPS